MINWVKIGKVAVTVASVALTVATSWSQQKSLEETVKKEVEKALASK